jgi:hypothetical protein
MLKNAQDTQDIVNEKTDDLNDILKSINVSMKIITEKKKGKGRGRGRESGRGRGRESGNGKVSGRVERVGEWQSPK